MEASPRRRWVAGGSVRFLGWFRAAVAAGNFQESVRHGDSCQRPATGSTSCDCVPLREAWGLTVTQIATAAGLSERAVRFYLAGARHPRATTLPRLARAVGLVATLENGGTVGYPVVIFPCQASAS
ncbi:helix-turn-helix domain-containing protein [Nonomuraea fuscirosea]|uniref:helix-turn-helix domain-containing protein n=1 Tax=Nonomuraea fuscirosea TaxID=1291556 RepID=UPI0033C6035B